MSGALHGAEGDDSKGRVPPRGLVPSVLTFRLVLTVVGVAGAVLLLIASFTNVIEITVGTTAKAGATDSAQTGWDRHGPALILLALLALWLLAVGLRGSRTALGGLVLVGVASLAIAWAWDRPHIHDAGSVGDIYAEAVADPGTAYFLETLGGALVLLSGAALLVLGRTPTRVADPAAPSAAERARARRERGPSS
jgi:hypothetical protein